MNSVLVIGSIVIVGIAVVKNWSSIREHLMPVIKDIKSSREKHTVSEEFAPQRQTVKVVESDESKAFRQKKLNDLILQKAKKEEALNKKIAPLQKEIKELDMEISFLK